jgi:hypothetical protein
MRSPASISRYSRTLTPISHAARQTLTLPIALHHRRVGGQGRHGWSLASPQDAKEPGRVGLPSQRSAGKRRHRLPTVAGRQTGRSGSSTASPRPSPRRQARRRADLRRSGPQPVPRRRSVDGAWSRIKTRRRSSRAFGSRFRAGRGDHQPTMHEMRLHHSIRLRYRAADRSLCVPRMGVSVAPFGVQHGLRPEGWSLQANVRGGDPDSRLRPRVHPSREIRRGMSCG